ncbi:MAG: cyclic nucleotide-binding domain-containing protein [Acidimicrobiia bacterium]
MGRTDAARQVRVILSDGPARRLAGGYTLFTGAEYGIWLAFTIYAFEQGGTTEAGVAALVLLLPAGLLAPVAGVLAERRRPDLVLRAGYALQGLGLAGAAAAVSADGPAPVVYAFVMVNLIASGSSRPAQALVTPRLVVRPEELTAINVVTEWSAQVAMFAAPALAGLLLTVSGPDLVFAVFGAALLVATVLVPRPEGPAIRSTDALVRGAWAEVAAGIRVAISEPSVRIVLLVSAAGFVTLGTLDVLTVTLALDHLRGTNADAAWLAASLGAGGVLGAGAGSLMVGRRLAPALTCGTLTFGLALALVATSTTLIVACGLILVAGIGQAIVTIAGHSLLQRCAPTESVGRIFALREALYCLGWAAGAGLAPLLVSALGIEGAFVAIGALVPLIVAARFGVLWRLDEEATIPVVELALLRRNHLFATLPAPAAEGLARNATWTDFATGDTLMRQGDPGDRYLAIAAGEFDIVRDGVVVAQGADGDGVGETALLRSVPCTATVLARTPVHALSIGGDDFLVAVTGHPATLERAETLSRDLTRDRPADGGAA